MNSSNNISNRGGSTELADSETIGRYFPDNAQQYIIYRSRIKINSTDKQDLFTRISESKRKKKKWGVQSKNRAGGEGNEHDKGRILRSSVKKGI